MKTTSRSSKPAAKKTVAKPSKLKPAPKVSAAAKKPKKTEAPTRATSPRPKSLKKKSATPAKREATRKKAASATRGKSASGGGFSLKWIWGLIGGSTSMAFIMWKMTAPLPIPTPVETAAQSAPAQTLQVAAQPAAAAPAQAQTQPQGVQPPAQQPVQPVVAAAPAQPAGAPAAPNVAPAPDRAPAAAPSTAPSSAPSTAPAPAAPASPTAAAAPAAPAAPAPQQQPAVVEYRVPSSHPLAAEFNAALSKKSLNERVEYWSQVLLDRKVDVKRLTKVAAAPKIEDTAPLLQPTFDCTTYVETVAALSKSANPDEFYKHLLSIRYRDGKATYLSRNHFPEADWLPNNIRAGNLEDMTRKVAELARVEVKSATKEIHRDRWLKKQVESGGVSRSLASTADPIWSQPVKATLEYVSFDKVREIAGKIPSGTIVNLVRSPDSHQPVLISHQGFVIQEGGKTFMRHSTATGHLKNVDLAEYVERLSREGGKWPLLGVSFARLK